VDGDSHFESGQKEYDEKRSSYLENLGLFVVRFTNFEVYDDLENVLQRIKDYINK